jgi:nitric oxide reductase activation protein
MGAALRHAGRCLAGVHRHRRLLLLLTDGEPSDVDAPDPTYLAEDARRAVAEQRRRGVHVFAVNLDPNAALGVRRIFGDAGYCQIDRLAALPQALPRLYARLVR